MKSPSWEGNGAYPFGAASEFDAALQCLSLDESDESCSIAYLEDVFRTVDNEKVRSRCPPPRRRRNANFGRAGPQRVRRGAAGEDRRIVEDNQNDVRRRLAHGSHHRAEGVTGAGHGRRRRVPVVFAIPEPCDLGGGRLQFSSAEACSGTARL